VHLDDLRERIVRLIANVLVELRPGDDLAPVEGEDLQDGVFRAVSGTSRPFRLTVLEAVSMRCRRSRSSNWDSRRNVG